MANGDFSNKADSGWEEIGRDSKIPIPSDPVDYKNFFHICQNLLLIANTDGVIVNINEYWRELFGYSSEDLVGKKIIEIIADDERDTISEMLLNLSGENNNIKFYCTCMSNNLNLKYTEWSVLLQEGILYCFVKDVTEIRELDEQLFQIQERFQLVLDHIPKQVYWKDVRSRYRGCNNQFVKTVGLSDPSELIGKNDFELPWNKTAQEYIENDLQVMESGEAQYGIERHIVLEDKTMWLKINKIPLHDKEKRIVGLLGTIEDITKQKTEYVTLKESEMKFRSLFENSFEAIAVASKEGKHVYVNSAYVKLFGYSDHKEIYKISVFDVVADEYKDNVREYYETRYSSGSVPSIYNVNAVRKDGSKFILNIHASTFDFKGKEHTLAIVRDITESRQTEEKLRESEVTLRALFDSITEFAVLIDLNGNITFANQTAADLIGTTVEDLTGRNIFELNKQKFDEKEWSYLKEIVITKKNKQFEEISDGVVNAITIYPVFDSYGMVSRFVIIRVDITVQQNAIEALRERDAMLSALINATTESAMLIDSYGKILAANETVAKRYDTPVNEFIGQYLFDLLSIQGAESRKKHIEYVLKTGIPIRFEEHVGGLIFDNSIYPVFSKDGNVIQLAIFGSDITKRKKAEEEITQMNNSLLEINSTKDKFFSIIAHDMRSPFQGLLGYSQILLDEYEDLTEDERKLYIANMNEISKNSYKLLENLLQWSRMQTGSFEFNPEVFNIVEEIEPTLQLLRKTAYNKNILIESFIKPRAYIMADKNMLNTIVRNLISNSIKFTKPGGKISLYSSELNNSVVFTIKDEGVGMSKEKLALLFKPEKNISTLGTENERGTGLGLLLCKEMIDKHKGEIWVESEEGTGSSFHFTMPMMIE